MVSGRSTGQDQRTAALLSDLRALRVAVFHADDKEREELAHHLQRFGCEVYACWPPRPDLAAGTDMVFLSIIPNGVIPKWALNRGIDGPVLVAVVNYESPTVIESVLKLGAENVVTSPVRVFGLLATLVLSRQIREERRLCHKKIQRLEEKMAGLRNVIEAKAILMRCRRVSEHEAYRFLREQAMAKRVTIEQMAMMIIEAQKVLPFDMATPAPKCNATD